LPDDPLSGVDRPGHADTDRSDRASRAAGALGDLAEELDDRVERISAGGPGWSARLRDHVPVPRDEADGPRGAADVDADGDAAPRSAPSPGAAPPALTTRRDAHRLKLAEVAERDAEARRRGARGRRTEADHLRLALSAVAAVGQRVVAPARVCHELG